MAAEENTLVLLYDTNPNSAKLIIKGFAKTDVAHQVRHVSNCQAMMNYIQESLRNSNPDKNFKPRLIVFNVDILNEDCKQTLSYLKNDKILKRIPILIFSASDDNQSIEVAFQYKVNSYLVKPSDENEFSKVVSEVASYWLRWNQLSP